MQCKQQSKSTLARRIKRVNRILALAVGGLAAQLAHADATWNGTTSQNWNTGTNWSANPPTGNFLINTTVAGIYPIVSSNSAFTPVDLILGSAANLSGQLDQTGGSLSTGNGNWMILGIDGGRGTFNISGGTLTAGSLRLARTGNAAVSSVSTVNVSGSGVINTGGLVVSDGQNNATTAQGTVNVNGGTLNSEGDVLLAFAGNGSSFGELNIATGATVNIATTTERWFIINQWDTTQGRLNINGGTLNLNANTDIRFSIGNGTGTSVVNLNNGAITAYGGNQTGAATGSVVDLNRAGGAVNNTFNLNGGTLTINQIITGNDTGNVAFNFNGGTLKAAGSSANFIDLGGATQVANVRNAGAVIDSNGFNVTAVQALVHSTVGGDNAIDGGLTKLGGGTLTMSAANTYTGTTTVAAGKLVVAGSLLNTGSVQVNGGTLDGTGSVGNVMVAPGGTVANGNGTTAQLTANSLTFSSTGALSLIIAGGNSTATAGLKITDSLTTSGGANSVTVGLSPTFALAVGTTYNLIQYGGLFTGNTTDFTYAGNTARITGTFGSSSGFITLTLNGDTPKWTGLDNGNWIAASTGGAGNWRLVTAATATDYIQGDIVLFDDSAAGSTAVTISAANVSPASTTFSNATKSYSLGGNFGIAGTGSLTKSGAGALVITNTNTFTGATVIAAGSTLTLGDGTAGHDGTIANTSGVTNDGSLEFNRFGPTTGNYVISGAGGVVKNGQGTQILGGTNTYTGGTTINAGILQLTTTAGAANLGTFYLNGGAFQVNLGTGANFNYGPTFNLTANSTIGNAAAGATNNVDGQINYTGTINGNGNILNIANSGLARLYVNGTVNNVTQINIVSGAMGFDLNSGANRGTAAMDVASGAALWYAGNKFNPIVNALTFHGGDGINNGGALFFEGGNALPAALTGTINLAAGVTGVGTAFANDTITLNGVISGPGGLKNISGTTVLAAANSYGGGTSIAGGAIVANNSAALGTGGVSVGTVTGSQLRLGGGVDVANALTINGGGVVAQGVLYVPTGDASYSGAVTITGATSAGGHFASGNGTLTLNGAITSSVPVSFRAGTVLLNNASSSYTAMNLQAGTVKLGVNDAIPTAASVSIGVSGAGIVDLNGVNQSLAGVTRTGNTATITNGAAASTSTLTMTGTSNFDGSINDGAGRVALVVANTGNLTLAGSGSFTGDIAVNGTLSASTFNGGDVGSPNPSALGDLSAAGRTITVNGGGKLSLTGGNVLGVGGSANTLSGITLVVNQGGVFETGLNSNGPGWWNKIGNVNLNGGVIHVGSGANTSNFQGLSLVGNVTVGGTTASTIDNFAGSDSSSNGVHLGQNGTGGVTFNVADVTADSNVDLVVATKLLDTSNVFNASGLTKTGVGTLQLSAANSYTGGTSIAAGTVQVSGSGTLGVGNVSLAGGSTLELAVSAAISDSATLSIDDGGTVLLTGGAEQVASLVLGGTTYLEGTFGGVGSGADNIMSGFFSSTSGGNFVVVPEPTSLGLIGLSGVAMLRRRRRQA